MRIYCEKPIQNVIEFKMKRQMLEFGFQKLKLMRGLGGYRSVTSVELTLKKIELSKQLFLLTISQGDEVIIPIELSQKNLAQSYQFYDSILNII